MLVCLLVVAGIITEAIIPPEIKLSISKMYYEAFHYIVQLVLVNFSCLFYIHCQYLALFVQLHLKRGAQEPRAHVKWILQKSGWPLTGNINEDAIPPVVCSVMLQDFPNFTLHRQ